MTKDELVKYLDDWSMGVIEELKQQLEVEDFDDVADIDIDEYMYESGYHNGIQYAIRQIKEKLND